MFLVKFTVHHEMGLSVEMRFNSVVEGDGMDIGTQSSENGLEE